LNIFITSQTHPYFRAPTIYVRSPPLMLGRQVLTAEEAKAMVYIRLTSRTFRRRFHDVARRQCL